MRTSDQEVSFGTETISYKIRFLSTRRTLGIEVHPDLSVLVRAPVDCDPQAILERVAKRAAWISKQLADFQRYRPRTPARQYVSGETHLYLGRQYRLELVAGEQHSVKMSRGHFVVTLPDKNNRGEVKALLHRWYSDRAREIYIGVLNEFLSRFKFRQTPRMIVRTMRSRWGSLSPAGTLTLNASLIHAPRACIEYVVAHELCHIRHRNHGSAFYRLLSQVMPDWQKRKHLLETVLL